MAAYIVATYDISNEEGYSNYVPNIIESLGEFNVEVLVADHASTALEGTAPGNTVVLKFADAETAQAWYDSESYGKGRHFRQDNTTNATMVLCSEFSMG